MESRLKEVTSRSELKSLEQENKENAKAIQSKLIEAENLGVHGEIWNSLPMGVP